MDRIDRLGRGAGYGAALMLTPYLLIKVSWVVGALLGLLPTGSGLGLVQWVVLNAATIGMAAIGITLALALVRPWGLRIPAPPLVFCGWVAAGFLVSMLPYALLRSLWQSPGPSNAADGHGSGGATAPDWEDALIQLSFVGMGVGLAVALPAYLRRRWPHAFTGRLGDGARSGGEERGRLVWWRWMLLAGPAVGLVWLYWAAGGTSGLSHPGDRDSNWRMLDLVFGLWAFIGSAAIWVAASGRPAPLPRGLPMTLGCLGSGALFAWSAWMLPFTAYAAVAGRTAGSVMPENLAVAAVLHGAAVLAGATMLRSLLRTYARLAGSV
ncbi:hypothetical protein ACFRCI_16255 [Streptomyces sp. NPDC056638]|uniref:hypothetical protein n=1 Tax=Streptomyces sp. NPDC056638 TaxID=3345887 RepID=UPI00368F2017